MCTCFNRTMKDSNQKFRIWAMIRSGNKYPWHIAWSMVPPRKEILTILLTSFDQILERWWILRRVNHKPRLLRTCCVSPRIEGSAKTLWPFRERQGINIEIRRTSSSLGSWKGQQSTSKAVDAFLEICPLWCTSAVLGKSQPSGESLFLSNNIWLVVSTPLKNISQLGWLFPIYGKIKMFQTTNQTLGSFLNKRMNQENPTELAQPPNKSNRWNKTTETWRTLQNDQEEKVAKMKLSSWYPPYTNLPSMIILVNLISNS